jgi:hypothetical protein
MPAPVAVQAVVDKDPEVNTDLVGGKADAAARVHRVKHVGDKMPQGGIENRHGARRRVEYWVTGDAYASNSHDQ